jgi:hypothetical protein
MDNVWQKSLLSALGLANAGPDNADGITQVQDCHAGHSKMAAKRL